MARDKGTKERLSVDEATEKMGNILEESLQTLTPEEQEARIKKARKMIDEALTKQDHDEQTAKSEGPRYTAPIRVVARSHK